MALPCLNKGLDEKQQLNTGGYCTIEQINKTIHFTFVSPIHLNFDSSSFALSVYEL